MNNYLTVFTPTYNRAKVLVKSYDALCRQSCKDFIWLIVDDGSSDDTKQCVENWIAEGRIRIEYIYQENGGKQRAVNTGIKNCRTEFFGFLDSDDYYCDDTVERFSEFINLIKNKNKIAGVIARRGTDENSPIGSINIPDGWYYVNFDYLIKKYRFYGDTCCVYKTEILRKHLYPEIKDRFILEDVMLGAINQKYDVLFVNKVYSISEYLPDGYTKNSQKLYHKNPYGYALGLGMITASKKRGILRRIKYTLLFTVWCKQHHIQDAATIVKDKRLYLLCFPISMLIFLFKQPKWYFNAGIEHER